VITDEPFAADLPPGSTLKKLSPTPSTSSQVGCRELIMTIWIVIIDLIICEIFGLCEVSLFLYLSRKQSFTAREKNEVAELDDVKQV
jgi:hypothetical protein